MCWEGTYSHSSNNVIIMDTFNSSLSAVDVGDRDPDG